MALWVKALPTKPDNLRWIPETHMVEKGTQTPVMP